MARNEQLIRQHKIIQVMERRRFGITLEELRDSVVEELGLTSLHTRSIRRDIEALQAAGMPIVHEETQLNKIWKLSRVDKGLHKLTITASELISLSVGRDLLLPLAGTQFWQGIEGFWNKVREQLPSGVWEHYERYRRTLRVIGLPAKTYEKHQGSLSTINRAIQQHRRLEAEYESIGKPMSVRKLEPYGIGIYQSSIYVVAVETGKDPQLETQERLRHWKLDRFGKTTALDEYFKADEDVDLDEHFGRSMGIFSGDHTETYKIQLSANAAKWIQEEPWHADQKLDFKPDGSCIMTVQAYHPMEIIPHVLKLGPEAKLLEPKKARKIIGEQLAKMASDYE